MTLAPWTTTVATLPLASPEARTSPSSCPPGTPSYGCCLARRHCGAPDPRDPRAVAPASHCASAADDAGRRPRPTASRSAAIAAGAVTTGAVVSTTGNGEARPSRRRSRGVRRRAGDDRRAERQRACPTPACSSRARGPSSAFDGRRRVAHSAAPDALAASTVRLRAGAASSGVALTTNGERQRRHQPQIGLIRHARAGW